jgi:hypothetical protein
MAVPARLTDGSKPRAAHLHHAAHLEGLGTMTPVAVEIGSRRKAVWGSRALGFALALAVGFSTSCGTTVQQGTGGSFLIISTLEAASGAEPTEFGGTLRSDVLTIVDEKPSIFNDLGRVVFRLGMKDPGSPTSPNPPSQFDFITIDRYRVRFIRSDGRNTPGVDVPYGFDGAFTLTVAGGDATGGFELVRHVAKTEAPLGALVTSSVIISTIAEITFYGRDVAGHEVTVTGRMLVDFGNFADPD